MVQITLNITKKYAFILLALILVLGAGIGVYAYGTSNPQNFGHSAGEIDGLDNGDFGFVISSMETSDDKVINPQLEYAADKNGSVLVMAHANPAQSCCPYAGGTFLLEFDGEVIDKAEHILYEDHAGSRMLSLIGEAEVTSGENYNVSLKREGVDQSHFIYPRITVLEAF